jgi:Zinc-binding domain of primase-helicase
VISRNQNKTFDAQEVKRQAAGREMEILIRMCGIDVDLLDGRGHPCPWCGGTDRFSLVNGGTGAVHCRQCLNEKNGDFFAAVEKSFKCKFPEAVSRVADYLGMKQFGGSGADPSTPTLSPTVKPKTVSVKPTNGKNASVQPRTIATPEERHNAYSDLLAALTLSDLHRENLCQRGLPDDIIENAKYRTWNGDFPFLKTFFSLDHPQMLHIPGFDTKLGFRAAYGLLIPVRNIKGQIIALRVRVDEPKPGKGKYRWVSSFHPQHNPRGVKAEPCVHVPIGIQAPCGILRVTEGELKADVTSFLSGTPTISIPGVNSWELALPVIRDLQADRVIVSLDADASSNQAVAKAQKYLVKSLTKGA